jgi:hypothetical protein
MLTRRRIRSAPRDVASMFTTAGLRRSAISANELSPAGIAAALMPRDGAAGPPGAAVSSRRAGAAEAARAGVMVPATTTPMRNATVAARNTVTARNRRVIVPLL